MFATNESFLHWVTHRRRSVMLAAYIPAEDGVMTKTPGKKKLSPARNALSILLFILAGALLAYAVYLFWDDRNQESAPVAPVSVPGHAQLKTVHDAFTLAGLDVEYGRASARVANLTPVGQELIVNGQPAYVFLFKDAEDREQAMRNIDSENLELTDALGDPVTSDQLSVASGSNVVVVLTGGGGDLAETIADAVATIP